MPPTTTEPSAPVETTSTGGAEAWIATQDCDEMHHESMVSDSVVWTCMQYDLSGSSVAYEFDSPVDLDQFLGEVDVQSTVIARGPNWIAYAADPHD